MHNEAYVQITDLITDQTHPPFNKPKKDLFSSKILNQKESIYFQHPQLEPQG